MTATHALLAAGFGGADGLRTLTLDRAFQGLPDAAHGGTALAAFLELAAREVAELTDGATPRRVAGTYLRRVPLGTPLVVSVARDGERVACRLSDASGALLVEGAVSPGGPDGEVGAGARASQSDHQLGGLAGHQLVGLVGSGELAPLPVSSVCLVCGLANPHGLRARLGCDADVVAGRWQPDARWAASDGRLAPLALTALLDETAFWLGALASGESGMTTELRVELGAPAGLDAPVTVLGRRADVRPRPGDGRYWETRVEARDPSGHCLAAADITFVAVRGAARRLVTAMRALNPPEVVRTAFPAYAG